MRLIAFDGIADQDAPLWARVVAPFAGQNRGAFFMPDVDDEVLVLFTNGDTRFPLVIGGLWNGAATAPADLGPEGNRYKRIRSKNGITITLDDQQGQETLTLETPGGQTVTLKDGPGSVTCEDSNGNSMAMEPAGHHHPGRVQGEGRGGDGRGDRRHGHRRHRDGEVLRRRQMRNADRDVGDLDQLHARRGEHLVRTR